MLKALCPRHFKPCLYAQCLGTQASPLNLLVRNAQRTLHNHQSHDFVQDVGCSHGCKLGITATPKSVQGVSRIMWLRSSTHVSYAGATSTMSAAIKFTPSNPRMIVRSSLVDQPPVSLRRISKRYARTYGENLRCSSGRSESRIQRVNIY